MTDALAIDILQYVKECWKKGIKDDDLVVKELKEKYNGNCKLPLKPNCLKVEKYIRMP